MIMLDRLVKTNINLMLNTEDLDINQKAILQKYKDNKYFRKIISLKAYYEIGTTIDYFNLTEKRLITIQKKLIERLFRKNNASKLSPKEIDHLDSLLLASNHNTIDINNNQEKLNRLKTFDKEYKKLLIERFISNWEKEDLPLEMNRLFQNRSNQNILIKREAEKIINSFDEVNDWTEKLNPSNNKALTTKEDILTIKKLCENLSKTTQDADTIFLYFFENLIKAKQKLRSTLVKEGINLEEYLNKLPDKWYEEPWYYAYVQYFGTDSEQNGTFKTLKKQLDYLETLGIFNLYILPHYESPEGDAGYDISGYVPAQKLGGYDEFKDFITEATLRGFRVATDLVFNHTSVEHKWFKAALNGQPKYFDYYLKCPASWKDLNINEILKDENGDLFLYLKEKGETGEELISKRILIFPDVSKTHWLTKYIKNLDKDVLFYREFYPFQVDLDLQNPNVIKELFKFLADECSLGILGKRTDAIAHWIKEPGSLGKNLPQTYALQKLIKQFIVHVSSKTIILPEVVTSTAELKKYAGNPTVINTKKTTTSGDALLDFQLQGMLREMLYFQKTTPFWNKIKIEHNKNPENTSVHLLPIEHHDETYMGFIDEIEAMREYIDNNNHNRKGIIYKNGMSAGARYSNCLNCNPDRIANAFFCLYIMPATPVIYYGTEIGAENNFTQMKERKFKQYETFQKLLGNNNNISLEKCEDPRELQRGSIESEVFFNALTNKYPAISVIKSMNYLRSSLPALKSYYLYNITNDSNDIGIMAMIKYDQESNSQNALIAISNLTELPKTYYLKKSINNARIETLSLIYTTEYPEKLNYADNIRISTDENNFVIKLNPYSGYLLKPKIRY